jgi:hypothetical protein
MFVYANIGASALYLLFVWLLSAAGAAWLAERKGYGERVGLFFGLILSAVGFAIVLLLPARPGSTWKVEGAFPNPGARRPLGLQALGPAASGPEPADALGPSLGDAPAAGAGPPAAEPPAGGEPPPAGEPPDQA